MKTRIILLTAIMAVLFAASGLAQTRYEATIADGAFTLPEGAVQVVYRNGLLQLAGHDYTISGTLLRFHDNCCEADENVTVKVKR